MPSRHTASTLSGDDDSGARLTALAPDASRRATIAARAAEDKKGSEIVVLDVGDIISITEMFVLVSATNTRQVKTIAEEIELALKVADGAGPRAVEGRGDATWVLMDFGDLIVHVFLAETREFYDLDRLWADAAVVEWRSDTQQAAAQSAQSR
jgi:ribosome-associated protein